MKIKELVKRLSSFDEESEVIIRRLFVEYDGGAYTDDVIIDDEYIKVEQDRFIIDITSEG